MIKPEPLKGKNFRNIYKGNTKRGELYLGTDVKSAVEWLKSYIDKTIEIREKSYNIYMNMKSGVNTYRIAYMDKEQACIDDLNWVKNKIDEAFEDVTREGGMMVKTKYWQCKSCGFLNYQCDKECHKCGKKRL